MARASTLCRFSVRIKETGKNCRRDTTNAKYRGIVPRRQLARVKARSKIAGGVEGLSPYSPGCATVPIGDGTAGNDCGEGVGFLD